MEADFEAKPPTYDMIVMPVSSASFFSLPTFAIAFFMKVRTFRSQFLRSALGFLSSRRLGLCDGEC